MAHKVGSGWIAPFKDGYEFADDTGRKPVQRTATGIYVGPNGQRGIRLNFAGCAAALMYFDIPGDASALRELAEALRGFADELDAGRRLH